MTVSTTQPAITVGGNNSQTVFQFPFIGVSASDIEVIFADTSGSTTTLPSTAYSVMLNAPLTGQLWGIGGSITYPLTGSPIADSTNLTISRILPLTQSAEISNQGNQYPVVTEQALDILCMQIQQVAGRTGKLRGTWVSGAFYNFGDVVQDGPAGSNSGNYYQADAANESGVWATDLANGDWSLAIPATIPIAPLPLSVANGGTGASTPGAALNNLGGISLSGNNAFTGNNTHAGTETFTGPISVPTAGSGDASLKAASTGFVNGTPLTLANGSTATTQSGSDSSTKVSNTAQVQAALASFVATFFAGSLGASGYQEFPGGLILQWITTGSLSSAAHTITLSSPNITFPNSFYGVVAISQTADSTATSNNYAVPINTSSFTLGNKQSGSASFFCILVGS